MINLEELNLPAATIDGWFGFVSSDGPDEDDAPDVTLANGTVRFVATTEAARIEGAWLGIEPVEARILNGRIVTDVEHQLPVRLLATDADIGVEDWAWVATFDVPGVKFEPLTFKAPQGTTVNLTADLIPIKSAPYQIVKGDSIVDAEADATGRLRFEISNGSFTNWVAVPVGPHTHDLGDVGGLQDALNGKTDTTDPRLSDARPPTAHTHEITAVDGLKAIIDRLTYDSGWRDISGLLNSGWIGKVYVRRFGNLVEVLLGGFASGADAGETAFALPYGFRPFTRDAVAPRPVLTTATNPPIIERTYVPTGQFRVLSRESGGQALYGSFTFTTTEPIPTTLPGTPA